MSDPIPLELAAFSDEVVYIELNRMNNQLANLHRQVAQQNAELSAGQARLQAAMELARLVTWEYDPGPGLFTFDGPFYAIYGTGAEQESCCSMSLDVYAQKFLLPEDAAALKTEIEKALVSPEPGYTFQLKRCIRLASGEERFFSTRARVSRDAAGQALKIFGADQDISELKGAEQALSQSETSFRSLYLASPIGVELYDAAGELVDVNPTCLKIFGLAEVGPVRGFQLFADPNVSEQVKEQLRQGLTVKYEAQFDFDTVRRLGLYPTTRSGGIYLDTQIKPLLDEAGLLRGYMAQLQEITGRRQAEEQVHQLNATLEQRVVERTAHLQSANRELESISYSIAHDLTTPLRAVNGYSHLLLNEYGELLNEPGQEYLRNIIQASLYLGQVNDGLRLLLKISRMELNIQKVNLGKLARQANDLMSRQEPGRAVTFICPEYLEVQADPSLLQTALEHLLENAWKFTQNCPDPVRIEFGCQQADAGQVYFLKDNGVGFEMAFAGKMFDNFQRLHTMEEYKGIGIGLAVVRRVVQRHGGQIWAEGAPGQGATVYFSLGNP